MDVVSVGRAEHTRKTSIPTVGAIGRLVELEREEKVEGRCII